MARRTKPGTFLPREHGAWGILLIPFLAACILARTWSWLLVPAVAAMLLASVNADSSARVAWGAQIVQLVLGLGVAAFVWKLALPLWFSAAANGVDLVRLIGAQLPSEPLRRVGFRALTVSLLHGALTVAVLWR